MFIATNGHAVVFQGFPYKQALIVERQQLPRFMADPAHTPVFVIPPFAATSLEAQLSRGNLDAISIHRNLVLGPEWRALFSLRNGSKIAYCSDHEIATEVRWLSHKGASAIITPMASIAVHTSGTKIQLSLIAAVPEPEAADYPNRFAAPAQSIVRALREALAKSQPQLRYEN